jgi:hypothetical protein
MRHISALLVSLLLFIVNGFSQDNVQIAVLELAPVGVSNSESITLTDRLRNELVQTGAFTILEREKMTEILKEQGFQLSGCTTSECAVEAGQLLNVQQICTGSIGKIGDLYTIAVRLIDVETGEILKTVSEDCRGSVEYLLTTSVHNVALKLAGKITTESAIMAGRGDIFIKSTPDAAEIFIDDLNTGKKTPATITNLPAGKHQLKLLKDEYMASKIITIESNNLVYETLTLEKNIGTLRVYSQPPEADIFIDRKLYGKTPRIIPSLATGKHALVLIKEDALYEKIIDITAGETSQIEGTLKQSAILKINADPTASVVFVNGINKGITPFAGRVMSGVPLTIAVGQKDYQPWKDEITLNAGDIKTFNLQLKRQQGKVALKGIPQDATLQISDKTYQITNNAVSIPVGTYEAEISKPGYISKKVNLNIQYDQTQTVTFSLPSKTTAGAFTRSLVLPGWGQVYQQKRTRAWVYSLGFIGSAAGSVFYTNKYNSAVNDYDVIRDQYSKAVEEGEILRLNKVMNDAYDDITGAENIRNLFYIGTAVIWLWNITDALLLPPAWHRTVSFSASNEGNNLSMGIAVKW